MLSIPKKAVLRYSRRLHDKREYGTHVWKPHPFDVLATRCVTDITAAKRRVIITRSGKYRYTPSSEYIRAYSNYINKMQNYVSKIKDKYNQRDSREKQRL